MSRFRRFSTTPINDYPLHPKIFRIYSELLFLLQIRAENRGGVIHYFTWFLTPFLLIRSSIQPIIIILICEIPSERFHVLKCEVLNFLLSGTYEIECL